MQSPYLKAYRLILTFVILLGALSAPGREFTNYQSTSHVKFRLVTSVCIDDYGFVWASNKMGVVKFSSTTQRLYRLPREASTVSSVNIYNYGGSIYAYNDKGGIFKYCELKDAFEAYLDISSMIDASFFSVRKIVVDDKGRLWITSSAGLLKYDEENGLAGFAGTNSVGHRNSITCSADGDIYVASSAGVLKIDGESLETTTLYPGDPGLASISLYSDNANGRLWIGTIHDGLKYLELDGCRLCDVAESSTKPVRALTPYKGSILLAGFDGDGVWFIDTVTGKVLEKEQKNTEVENSLGSNGVYDICYHNSLLYVATYGGGLYACNDYFPPIVHSIHRINDPNSLADDNVHSVFEDSFGRDVLATDNGVSIYDMRKGLWRHICSGEICTHAVEDSRGNYWIATFDNGWFVYDASTLKQVEHHRTSPLNNSDRPLVVRNFLEDSDGDIWILGQNLILRKDFKTGGYIEYSQHSVNDACILPDGSIAMACSHALVQLDKYENTESVLWTGDAHSVTCNERGIWCGTSGSGVLFVNYDSEECEFITTKEGLSSDFAESVMVVDNDLWIGTEIGLNRYDISDRSIRTYKSIPLLGYSNFNTSACGVQKDGSLLFGTSTGMLKFQPDEMLHQIGEASMYVENIRFSNVSVRDLFSVIPNEAEVLEIKHQQNNVILEFVSSGISTASFFFKWKMDPVDQSWSPLNEDGRCRYTNLPSGRNVFHLVMTDALGQEVDSRDIVIDVKPPFWRTWWFILLVLLFLYLGVQSAWIWYSMKIKQRVVPMVSISREIEKHVDVKPSQEEKDPFVEKAVEVVYANIQDPDFDKDSFASEMNVSSSSLYKKLKTMTGQSPAEFIKTIRMSAALKLLQSHQHTITEVSELCGYSSQSYFSTAFKNFYGKSPNEI